MNQQQQKLEKLEKASKMYKKVSLSRKSPVKTYAKIKVIISKKLRLSLTYVIAQEKRI